MEDFCVGYHCDEPQWRVIAVACVCFENALWEDAEVKLKEYDSMFDSRVDSNVAEEDLHSLKRYF